VPPTRGPSAIAEPLVYSGVDVYCDIWDVSRRVGKRWKRLTSNGSLFITRKSYRCKKCFTFFNSWSVFYVL